MNIHLTSKPAVLGGNPIRTQSVPSRQVIDVQDIETANEILKSGCLSAFIGAPGEYFLGGRWVKALEKHWSEYVGANHAVSVNSWTSGLVTAVGALQLQPGDEMICPPTTMSASAACGLFYGVIPVFADVDKNTFCLDPKSIEAKITSRTKAIMVVHLFGLSADMDAILKISKKHGLAVIEDAAQSPGATYRGEKVGCIGDIGGFSFNYHKHLHCGEGGMIVTQSAELARNCQLIRNHGENGLADLAKEKAYGLFGANYRLTELQSGIVLEQSKRLERILKHRRELANHFRGNLENIKGIHLPKWDYESEHAYCVFPFRYLESETGLSRLKFVKAVNAEYPMADDLECRPLAGGYVKPLYFSRLYQDLLGMGKSGFPFNLHPNPSALYVPGICPVAEQLHREEICTCLLIREPMTTQDIDQLTEAIRRVLAHAAEIERVD